MEIYWHSSDESEEDNHSESESVPESTDSEDYINEEEKNIRDK